MASLMVDITAGNGRILSVDMPDSGLGRWSETTAQGRAGSGVWVKPMVPGIIHLDDVQVIPFLVDLGRERGTCSLFLRWGHRVRRRGQ